MPAANASRHKHDSRALPSITSMLSHIRRRCSYSQSRASFKSPAVTCASQPEQGRRNAKHPYLTQKENTLFSIVRRVVDGISTGTSTQDIGSITEAERRAKLERRHLTRAAYGCTTIKVNQECFDVPTLSRESGLRMVRHTNILLDADRSDFRVTQFGKKRELDGGIQPPPYTTGLQTGLEEPLSRFHIGNPSRSERFAISSKPHRDVSSRML
jgi:hypothetical protein